MECDSKYLEGCKKKLTKIKRIPKPKKENEVFEKKTLQAKQVRQVVKCPKGFKVCNCNPKKLKCKRIKKTGY